MLYICIYVRYTGYITRYHVSIDAFMEVSRPLHGYVPMITGQTMSCVYVMYRCMYVMHYKCVFVYHT